MTFSFSECTCAMCDVRCAMCVSKTHMGCNFSNSNCMFSSNLWNVNENERYPPFSFRWRNVFDVTILDENWILHHGCNDGPLVTEWWHGSVLEVEWEFIGNVVSRTWWKAATKPRQFKNTGLENEMRYDVVRRKCSSIQFVVEQWPRCHHVRLLIPGTCRGIRLRDEIKYAPVRHYE